MDKIRILFLSSDPSDAGRLRLGQELREIREKLQLSKQRDTFQLESREAVRPGDITQAIFDVDPQIVHFSGHGMSTGELCFENITGTVQPVAPSALSSLFKLVSKQVKCVVLNACHSESQAKAIVDHIPCVIGMNQAIGDSAAIAFSVGFYRALGSGRSVEDSYKFACVEIELEGISEHLTPVFYSKELEFSKANNVLSSEIKERFEYTAITLKQDRKLFIELLKSFPPNGRGAIFLKEHDVGNTIHNKDLESIDNFIDSWADVMHEFLNPEIEEKRKNFMSILSDFQSELNVNIWSIAGGHLFSMHIDELAVPKHRLEARDRLNKMGTQAFKFYEDLLRCCRIMLGAVDDE
ncbi:CHAT domain-containing protein [Anabaena minutissima FACHB-250]|nr:CHAT domain-containing protein [Anabaena minutissima FACHB-250]